MEYIEESIQPRQTAGTPFNAEETDSAIVIKVGQDLDLRLLDIFMQAIEIVQRGIISRIEVDLSRTRRIFDSGLALLMSLNHRNLTLSGKIRIINCDAGLKSRLRCCVNTGLFSLEQVCRE